MARPAKGEEATGPRDQAEMAAQARGDGRGTGKSLNVDGLPRYGWDRSRRSI